MPNTPKNTPPIDEQKKIDKQNISRWDNAIHSFSILSEASNIGIVINIISKWFAGILTVAAGLFSYIVFYADPLIYFFKSLIRLTKIVGREIFGITFEEEKNGSHKNQTAADVVSLVLFTLAIPLFFGLILSPPVAITVAWFLALSGLAVIGFYDYNHQEKMAKEKYDRSLLDKNMPARVKEKIRKEFVTKRNSKYLFIGLLIGLSFLLLCGSAAVFAPPVLVPILFIASKIATGILGFIAVARFANWMYSDRTSVPENKGPMDSPKIVVEPDSLLTQSPSSRFEVKQENTVELEPTQHPVQQEQCASQGDQVDTAAQEGVAAQAAGVALSPVRPRAYSAGFFAPAPRDHSPESQNDESVAIAIRPSRSASI